MHVTATSIRVRRKKPPSRQTRVRLELHQVEPLTNGYRAGAAAMELAERFGIHGTTVAAILHRQVVEPRQLGLSDEQVAEACRLYSEGWSLARLADASQPGL